MTVHWINQIDGIRNQHFVSELGVSSCSRVREAGYCNSPRAVVAAIIFSKDGLVFIPRVSHDERKREHLRDSLSYFTSGMSQPGRFTVDLGGRPWNLGLNVGACASPMRSEKKFSRPRARISSDNRACWLR